MTSPVQHDAEQKSIIYANPVQHRKLYREYRERTMLNLEHLIHSSHHKREQKKYIIALAHCYDQRVTRKGHQHILKHKLSKMPNLRDSNSRGMSNHTQTGHRMRVLSPSQTLTKSIDSRTANINKVIVRIATGAELALFLTPKVISHHIIYHVLYIICYISNISSVRSQ